MFWFQLEPPPPPPPPPPQNNQEDDENGEVRYFAAVPPLTTRDSSSMLNVIYAVKGFADCNACESSYRARFSASGARFSG